MKKLIGTIAVWRGDDNFDVHSVFAKPKITIPVMRDGYIQWLEPIFTVPGERYRMFGDHGNFTPVVFR